MFKPSVLKRGVLKQSMSKHFYVSMNNPSVSNQRTEAEYV